MRSLPDRLASLAVLLSLALPPRALLAAPAAASSPTTIEVEMDPSIPDAETLSEWIHEQAAAVLSERGPSPEARGTVRISVSGALYEYEVTITEIPEGSSQEQSRTWPCECTNEQLLARIRTDVGTAVAALEGNAGMTPPPAPSTRRSPFSDVSRRGWIAVGLTGGGAVLAIGGIALVGVGARDGNDKARNVGIPVMLLGVGALAAGTTMLILEHRKRLSQRGVARATLVPWATPHGAHLGLTGRF